MMIAAVMEVPGLAMRITKSAATGPHIGQCSQGGHIPLYSKRNK